MTKHPDQCEWPGCSRIVPDGEGMIYYGRLLCDKHMKQVWEFIDANKREALFRKLKLLTVYRKEQQAKNKTKPLTTESVSNPTPKSGENDER